MESKLPGVGTTIFTRMSALAQEHDAINLAQGFPDFPAPDALVAALGKHAAAGRNQYAPMAGLLALRECIAEQLARFRNLPADPETEITIVPGATEGIFCTVQAFVSRGDEVIVLDPAYDSYVPAIHLAGGCAVRVPLLAGEFAVDWDSVEAALSPRTRMIMLNTPHNPCGAVLTEGDLVALARIVDRHNLIVCSDEVYEHLVFDEARHVSVLDHPVLRQRSVAHYSFGKTFSVTGWKTGYFVASPALTAEIRKVHQFVAFVAVTPVQHALAEFISENPEYPATLGRDYAARRDLFLEHLRGSSFSWIPAKGSFFQILDYSALSSEMDTELAERWTREVGVASIPVSVFYEQAPEQKLLRFCFAKSDEVLIEAARRLCAI